MLRSNSLIFAIFTMALVAFAGCGSNPQWEITRENRSNTPCSFFVVTDGGATAKVENVAKGKAVTLTSGVTKSVVIDSVRVVHGEDEHTLAPNLTLPAGNKYAIVVTEDGKVETHVSD